MPEAQALEAGRVCKHPYAQVFKAACEASFGTPSIRDTVAECACRAVPEVQALEAGNSVLRSRPNGLDAHASWLIALRTRTARSGSVAAVT